MVGSPALHQAGLCRRSTHIEGDDVFVAERLPNFRRGDDSADRSGLHHHHGAADRRLGRHDAAIRLHDGKIAAETARFQLRMQIAHIAANDWADVRVDDRGGHALVLAIFAQNLVRQGNVAARERLLDDFSGDALVLGIGIGMKKAHRNGIDAILREFGASRFDAFHVQRLANFA